MKRPILAIAAVLVLAGCASSASPGATQEPSTAPSASPAVSAAATSVPTVAASPTATPRLAVLPGEAWIAFQGDNGDGLYGVRL
ncbi:MAG: lipoprotein, partial [Chloroflexi bacterium]|nr:lipoprotein [Chloroflexota bacterium]